MRRLGLVARADDGGLGTLTREFARHLRPDATLVVDLGDQGRGPVHPGWYADAGERLVTEGWPTDADVLWLLDRCDVAYSAEVLYHPRFLDLAEGRDSNLPPRAQVDGRRVPVYLHAMPELYDAEVSRAEVLLPTPWLADRPRFADACHLPVPVALDRFDEARDSRLARAHAPNPGPPRLLHVGGPAMLDRNGTELVAAACAHVRTPCELTVIGHPEFVAGIGISSTSIGQVDVRFVESAAPDYWRNYEGHDLLVQPRRYGGLSLVHQEAAAAGLGLVTLDRGPEALWPGVHAPVTARTPHRMKGGLVDVASTEPHVLASAIELALDNLPAVQDGSLEWADGLSWTVWRPRYERLLRGR